VSVKALFAGGRAVHPGNGHAMGAKLTFREEQVRVLPATATVQGCR
jgi:hypothetical protein